MIDHTLTSAWRTNMFKSLRTSALAVAVIACSTGSAKEVQQQGSSAGTVASSERSAARTLAAGTRIDATIQDTLSSRVNHSGDVVHALIGAAVQDSRGRVVVPAGSTVTLTVDHIDPGNDQNQPDGRLALVVSSITIDGKVIPITASLEPVAHRMVGRGITKDEAERIGAGTAIGAVAGQLIGKSTKSTVIGGAVGAVAGTAVAVRYAYRDVVVPAGTPITFTLTEQLVAAK